MALLPPAASPLAPSEVRSDILSRAESGEVGHSAPSLLAPSRTGTAELLGSAANTCMTPEDEGPCTRFPSAVNSIGPPLLADSELSRFERRLRVLVPALAQRCPGTTADVPLSDVVLVADGTEFPCHRIVLACSSEYFSCMFEGSFVEAQVKPRVQLPGKSSETVAAVLKMMYCTTTVEEVLKEDPSHCLHILELAREWLLQDILERTIRFIKEEIRDIAMLEHLVSAMPHGEELRGVRELCQEKLRSLRESDAAKGWNNTRSTTGGDLGGGRRSDRSGAGRWPVGGGQEHWSAPISCPRGLGW